MIVTEACGKFILGGEHSVVYGGCGLAFPLPQMKLRVWQDPNLKGLWINGNEKSIEEFTQLQNLCRVLGATESIQGLKVESTLAVGAGLGWSAAFCAALAKQFSHKQGAELAKLALEGERFFHGSPSGIDPFAVCLEKPIAFWSKDLRHQELKCDNFLKEKLCFVLVDSELRHSTLKVIEEVKKLKAELPLLWQDLISTLSDNAEAMLRCFEGQPRKLGRIMNDSHFRLMQLGVSCESLDDIAEKLRKEGALGAKLTGAGKGGFVLALFDTSRAQELGLPIVYS